MRYTHMYQRMLTKILRWIVVITALESVEAARMYKWWFLIEIRTKKVKKSCKNLPIWWTRAITKFTIIVLIWFVCFTTIHYWNSLWTTSLSSVWTFLSSGTASLSVLITSSLWISTSLPITASSCSTSSINHTLSSFYWLLHVLLSFVLVHYLQCFVKYFVSSPSLPTAPNQD